MNTLDGSGDDRAGAGIAGRSALTAPNHAEEASAPAAVTRLLELQPGLYAIAIGAASEPASEIAGMGLPSAQVSSPPCDDRDPVEIIAGMAEFDSWVGPEGGTLIARSPAGGGRVLITTYAVPGRPVAPLEIEIRRLDRAETTAPVTDAAPPDSRSREISTQISLHIERIGDRQFPGQGWVGTRGQRLRIEALSAAPTERISAADLEYRAIAANGRETPWVNNGQLCGTRGRGLPLTGFAMRLAERLQGRFDIVYQGSFFAGGVVGPRRNGEVCESTVANDPLEAVNIRLIERIGA